MADNYKVPVTVPNVPANCVKLIEDLIAELERAHGSLHTSAKNMQIFMGQANGAVQNVATTSQGKATRALSDTWHYTRMDGNHAHTGMTGAATHLADASTKLSTYLPALKTGMSIMQSVTSQGGKVMVGEASQIEGQLADFTTTLNNVGLALEGAATLLNTLSGNIPNACATGFSPKGPHPVFAGNAFDGEKNNGKANRSGTSDGSDEPFEDEPYYDEIDPPESMLNDPRLQNLIDRVVQIPGIEPEEWSTLNAYQRAQVLQAVDHEIAAAYGITPDHVRIASLPDDITGYFREENGTKFVTINHTALGSDEYSEEEVLEALAHEVRHSYQHDMMLQDPATQSASDRELAQKWRENNENYNNGEDDLETYKNQPVEVDAREWAVAFMTKLCE